MPSTRHTYELMNRLEQVIDRGHAEITDKELRRWYGQERIGVSVWRDIHDRWMEFQEDPHAQMTIMTMGTGHGYVFIRSDGLSTSGISWVDLAVRARLTKGPFVELDPETETDASAFVAKPPTKS